MTLRLLLALLTLFALVLAVRIQRAARRWEVQMADDIDWLHATDDPRLVWARA